MTGIAWWPVTLILLAAPFGVWGYDWLQTQRLLAQHSRQVNDLRDTAAKDKHAAYIDGRGVGIAEVRVQQQAEIAKTEAVIRQLEAELEEAHGAMTPPTPQDIVELCRRSASCRDRGSVQ